MGLIYIMLGIITLLVPGFFLTLVIYPKREQLDFWQRVAVSIGLSVLVLIYIGFALAKLDSLLSGPFFGTVIVVCIVFAFLAYFRGGFVVLVMYKDAAMRVIRKLKPPKPKQAQSEEAKPQPTEVQHNTDKPEQPSPQPTRIEGQQGESSANV